MLEIIMSLNIRVNAFNKNSKINFPSFHFPSVRIIISGLTTDGFENYKIKLWHVNLTRTRTTLFCWSKQTTKETASYSWWPSSCCKQQTHLLTMLPWPQNINAQSIPIWHNFDNLPNYALQKVLILMIKHIENSSMTIWRN